MLVHLTIIRAIRWFLPTSTYGIQNHTMKRQPLQAFKVYRKGYIMEVAIYQVPVSTKTPQGYRFRF